MAFRDLQHQLGKLTSEVKTQIAKNNPLQNEETKDISMWIFQERNILAETKTLAYEHGEANKLMYKWAKEEGQDLEDIGAKLSKLLNKQTEIEQEFAAKYQKYRHALKSIRERENSMTEVREKKKALQARIAALEKSSPKSSKLKEFQHELTSLDNDTRNREADIADFKRFALREAFYLRFNAMAEYAEKSALLAGFGKYIVDLIDIEPTDAQQGRKPYASGTESAMILADTLNAVNNWKPSNQDFRPTLAEGEGQVREDALPQTEASVQANKSSGIPEPSTTEENTNSTSKVTDCVTDNAQASGTAAVAVESSEPPIISTPQPSAPLEKPSSGFQPRNSTETDSANAGDIPAALQQAPSVQSPIPFNNNEALMQTPTRPNADLQDSNKEEIVNDTPVVLGVAMHSPWQASTAPPLPSPRPSHLTAYSTGLPEDGLANYNSGNYGQLYRRVSHLRQNQRPYAEFQQHVVQPRVGAGGFRIPVTDETLPPYEEGSANRRYTDEKNQ
ncbi:hypothetical protein INT43_001697 [Umbelopsis isabellina]|uniref:Eisosome component PIL1-domain-containing protein n=1 Tax=Mortierella isabellina TaxID=91625 RepID=A0A8H7UAY2_MORIS|nr:hypothetical protein INT43_001697 [Umbelopsis isabellina]